MVERILDLIDAGRALGPNVFNRQPMATGRVKRYIRDRVSVARHATKCLGCQRPTHSTSRNRELRAPAMNSAIRYKLIVMMFLEYLIWGAWFPLLNNYIGPKYLNFDWLQGALVNDAFAIMSLTAIFFGGQLADRYFSQEKFLAFSLLVSGLALLGLPVGISAGATGVSNPGAVEAAPALASTFWLVFRPDDALQLLLRSDALRDQCVAFANLRTLKRSSASCASGEHWAGSRPPFRSFLCRFTISSPLLGSRRSSTAAYCLTLPSTPPVKSEGEAFAPFKAFRLLSVPTILVLFIVTFLDSLVHNAYFISSGPFYEAGLRRTGSPPR